MVDSDSSPASVSADTEPTAADDKGAAKPGIHVFVYGSLKEGHPNHGVLKGSTFIGRTYIQGDYTMLDLGYFPGVVNLSGAGDGRIFGEVYTVDLDGLNSLDILEGHPDYFKREHLSTEFGRAWMYQLPDEYAEHYPTIKSGQWTPTKAERKFWAEQKDRDPSSA